MPTTKGTVELFEKHGFKPVFKESPGGHTWINWRAYLTEFVPQLFQAGAPKAGTAPPASRSWILRCRAGLQAPAAPHGNASGLWDSGTSFQPIISSLRSAHASTERLSCLQ